MQKVRTQLDDMQVPYKNRKKKKKRNPKTRAIAVGRNELCLFKTNAFRETLHPYFFFYYYYLTSVFFFLKEYCLTNFGKLIDIYHNF